MYKGHPERGMRASEFKFVDADNETKHLQKTYTKAKEPSHKNKGDLIYRGVCAHVQLSLLIKTMRQNTFIGADTPATLQGILNL